MLLLPLAFALVALGGVAYQSVAQVFHLGVELPDFAFLVTAFWALVSAGLITAALVTAARIRHRRSSHRFPVTLNVHYTTAAGTLPLVPAVAHDVNTVGLALSTSEPLERSSPITLHLRLDDELLVVSGTIVRGAPSVGTYGIAFDPLPADTRDLIARWCFRHPFGPELDLHRSTGDDTQTVSDDDAAAAA